MNNHKFNKKIAGFTYCSECGLVILNNAFTRWCIKHGCDHEEHPDFKRKRLELTKKD